MKKSLLIFSIILAVGVFLTGCSTAQKVSGTWHNATEDFSEGISVDGTAVINGSGQYVGAVNGTTGAFSSTLDVTGASTLTGNVTAAGNIAISTTTTTYDLNIGTTGTSSIYMSKPCFKVGTVSGGVMYVYMGATDWATSSVSCF